LRLRSIFARSRAGAGFWPVSTGAARAAVRRKKARNSLRVFEGSMFMCLS
jgi:hypothetical protein